MKVQQTHPVRYKIHNKLNGKEWGYLYNRKDAENTILHLEDMYGIDGRFLIIIEVV